MQRKYYLLFILSNPLLNNFYFSPLNASNNSIKYEFESIKQGIVVSIFPIDLNDDGIEELVSHNFSQIDVWESKLERCIQSFIIPEDRKYSIFPIKTGRLDSLCFLFNYTTKDSSVYKLFRYFNNGVKEKKEILNYIIFTGTNIDGNREFDQTIRPWNYIFDSSGKRMLIFSMNSGGDKAKRGVVAAIPETGESEWEYLMGPQLHRVILDDLDDNGLLEIVVGSYAPDNKVYYNGTKDNSSYVFVIDCDGKLRWRFTIGPYFTGAWTDVCDVTGDGKKEIIVFRYGTNPNVENQNELIILDPKTAKVLGSFQAGIKFSDLSLIFSRFNYKGYCYDLNGDGRNEIIIGNSDGIVRMFDGDPKVIATSDNFKKEIAVSDIADLDGDRLPEVVCKTADNHLIILNHQLTLLKDYKLNPASGISVVRSKGKSYLLITRGMNGRREYNLLEFYRVGFARGAVSRYGRTIKWIFAATLIILVFLFFRYLFLGQQTKRIFYNFLEEAGLLNKALILKNNGKIIRLGSDWEIILQTTKHEVQGKRYEELSTTDENKVVVDTIKRLYSRRLPADKAEIVMDGNDYVINSNYIALLKSYCFILIDLVEQEYLRQVKAWANVSQRLAHGIKNPLTTIKLNAEELLHKTKNRKNVEPRTVEEYIDPIIRQVTKLKKITDSFMHFVEFERPILKPVDVNSVIRELIPQWQPDKIGRIQIDWELDDDLPMAMIDLKQFEDVLKNIFFNALESIENEGRILISTSKVELFAAQENSFKKSSFVDLQIQDTGCGIPSEYLDKVKMPYFTLNKSEGTGLGLSIVQKIMDSHGGQFEIQSEAGVGTTVTLRFKAKI